MPKIKIEIKSWATGSVLFAYESEGNTIAKTLEQAIKSSADLSYANLSSADLHSANLSYADLSSADLSYANLSSADLSYADLSYANLSYANLRSADLREVKEEQIPIWWKNACSRDMLFVFGHLKAELPFLREKLMNGKVNGTQYKGECACLIGTLGNADGGIEKVCTTIPFYTMGLENYGEQWFWNIKEGDTPKKSHFARHAVELIDMVLEKNKPMSKKPKQTKRLSKN